MHRFLTPAELKQKKIESKKEYRIPFIERTIGKVSNTNPREPELGFPGSASRSEVAWRERWEKHRSCQESRSGLAFELRDWYFHKFMWSQKGESPPQIESVWESGIGFARAKQKLRNLLIWAAFLLAHLKDCWANKLFFVGHLKIKKLNFKILWIL